MNPMNRPHLQLQFLVLSQIPGTFLCLAASHLIVIIIISSLEGYKSDRVTLRHT